MKLREPSPARCSAIRISQCLAVLLLAGWNTTGSRAGGRLRVASPSLLGYTWVDSIPYAIVSGAPPLRFAPEPPAPEPVVVAMTPPIPANTSNASPALPDAHPSEKAVVLDVGTELTSLSPAAKSSPVEAAKMAAPRPEAGSTATSILPDELHPQVRPEDFLPFFQVPGALHHGSQGTMVVPVSTTLPGATVPATPSSATYTQTPK